MKPITITLLRVKVQSAVALISLTLLFIVGTSRAADTTASPAEPVDLTGKYNTPVNVLTNMNGFPAWKSAAVGHQVFRGVPFQIGGLIYLWGEGRATNHTSSFPERVPDIAVNRTFQTLYLCHGSYYKSPDETPVFQVVFRYDDGSSATNALRFGDDILDWKVSQREAPLRTPSGPNSMLAWMGGVFSPTDNSQLRYCMTALNNPHPDHSVATIDLISCKTRTVPFILAMTTGPSGLMQTGEQH
jgi:hypothetical protein